MTHANDYSTQVLSELYKAFDHFNTTFMKGQLPSPMITINVEDPKRCGYFRGDAFEKEENKIHNIGINLIYLNNVEETLHTLIHEMVHMWNHINGVVDCSKTGRHNQHFARTCALFGLSAHKDGSKGLADTRLEAAALAAINSLKIDDKVFTLYCQFNAKERKESAKPGLKAVMISEEVKTLVAEAAEGIGCDQKTLAEMAIKFYLHTMKTNPTSIPTEFQIPLEEEQGE